MIVATNRNFECAVPSWFRMRPKRTGRNAKSAGAEQRTIASHRVGAQHHVGRAHAQPQPLEPGFGAELHLQVRQQGTDGDLALAVQTGNKDAAKKALAVVADKKASSTKRASLHTALAEAGEKQLVPVITGIIGSAGDNGLKKAAMSVAGRFDDEKIAKTAIAMSSLFTAATRRYEFRLESWAAVDESGVGDRHTTNITSSRWAMLINVAESAPDNA